LKITTKVFYRRAGDKPPVLMIPTKAVTNTLKPLLNTSLAACLHQKKKSQRSQKIYVQTLPHMVELPLMNDYKKRHRRF